MYCLHLLNKNDPPYATSTKEYFFDDLETFQKKSGVIQSWTIQKKLDLNAIRWNCPVLLEDSKARVIEEKACTMEDRDIIIYNRYQFPCFYHVYHMDIILRKIQFQNQYYKVGSFSIEGMYDMDLFDNQHPITKVKVWGNPMVHVFYTPRDLTYPKEKEMEYCKKDRFSSIAFGCLAYYESQKEMLDDSLEAELSKETLCRLLEDIPGEAG